MPRRIVREPAEDDLEPQMARHPKRRQPHPPAGVKQRLDLAEQRLLDLAEQAASLLRALRQDNPDDRARTLWGFRWSREAAERLLRDIPQAIASRRADFRWKPLTEYPGFDAWQGTKFREVIMRVAHGEIDLWYNPKRSEIVWREIKPTAAGGNST